MNAQWPLLAVWHTNRIHLIRILLNVITWSFEVFTEDVFGVWSQTGKDFKVQKSKNSPNWRILQDFNQPLTTGSVRKHTAGMHKQTQTQTQRGGILKIAATFTVHTKSTHLWHNNLLFSVLTLRVYFLTWAKSYFPRMHFSLTPGKSGTRPPLTKTMLCSCKLCPSPGM